MTILTKTIRTPVKAQEQPPELEGDKATSINFEGYAAVFDNVDSGGDKIVKGAFADTLATRYPENGAGVPVYWNHETNDPFKNLGTTVTAYEDDHGLKVEGTIDTTTDVGAQVAKLLKEHRVAQMSFAYSIDEGGWMDGTKNEDGTYNPGYYELRKLDLFEVSICPIGMNQETEVSAKKAMLGLDADQEPTRPEPTISQVEAAKRRLRLLTIN